MSCTFCRSRGHTRSSCEHPFTRLKQEEIVGRIHAIYTACVRRVLTREEFFRIVHVVLDSKNTVVELKMCIEYLKKRTTRRYGAEGNKPQLTRMICNLSIDVFNYTFNMDHRLVVPGVPGVSEVSIVIDEILTPNRPVTAPQAAEYRPPSPPNINLNREFQEAVIHRPALPFSARRLSEFPERIPPHVPPRVPPHVPPRAPFTASPLTNAAIRISTLPTSLTPIPQINIHKTDKVCKGEECSICYNALENETYAYLNCSHEFCKTCLKNCISRRLLTCPMCRSTITDIYTHTPVVNYSL